MIISHKHKFIYIKSNKTAGTSTEILLESFCDKTDIVTPHRENRKTDKPRNFQKYEFKNHRPAKFIKKKIGDEVLNSYFKFTNIRNPWDREVSGYFWQVDLSRKNSLFAANEVSFEGYLAMNIYNDYSRYYRINGIPSVNDYIRYEHLVEDTHRILKKFNIDISDMNYPTAKTKSRAQSKHIHYTEYYDNKTREIIAEKYAKDIEYFGYKFGE